MMYAPLLTRLSLAAAGSVLCWMLAAWAIHA